MAMLITCLCFLSAYVLAKPLVVQLVRLWSISSSWLIRNRVLGRHGLVNAARALAPSLARYSSHSPELVRRLALIRPHQIESELEFFAFRILFAVAMGLPIFACLILMLAPSFLNAGILGLLLLSMLYLAPASDLNSKCQRELDRAERNFPGFLDGLALALEAGQSFPLAVFKASERLQSSNPESSSPWLQHLRNLAADLRAGRERLEVMERFEQLLPTRAVQQFCAAAITADRSGLSLAPILRQHAGLGRTLFQHRVEQLAMQAPVKLLGPLIVCIFPCTFIVLLTPLIFGLKNVFS